LGKKSSFLANFGGGKDNLHVRKDDLDAVFFLSATPRLGVVYLRIGFSITNIGKWKFKGDNFIAF
jgi:hypothetical protein